MSFASQDPNQHLEQKVIEPLLAFRRQAGPLNQKHNECIEQFTKIMMGLLLGSDGETAFQGPGANALAELVGRFLDGERKLCGTDPFTLEGRLQDAAVICERHAHHLQETLAGLASSRSATALFADIGLDGPGDEGPDDPSEVAIGEFYQYQADMNGPITEPLGELPDLNDLPTASAGVAPGQLTPLAGTNAAFLRSLGILGIAAGGTAVLIAGAVVITALTPEQENLAQRLYADYGSSGLSLDDIRAMLARNPNLTEQQLRDLLAQYATVVDTHPHLVSLAGGSLELFLLFIQLAYDPAKATSKKDLLKGIHEAEVVLDLAEQGKLRWPIKRDPSGAAEIIDGNNQAWDEKGYVSGLNPSFNLVEALRQIRLELFTAHENVILDVSRLSPADAKALYREVQIEGWGSKILWWPTPPTP